MTQRSLRYHTNLQETKKLAQQTLKEIDQLGLAPNPIHYTLIFELLGDIDPNFSKKLTELIQAKQYQDDLAFPIYQDLVKSALAINIPTDQVQQLIDQAIDDTHNWNAVSKQQQGTLSTNLANITQCDTKEAVNDYVSKHIIPPINLICQETERLQNKLDEWSQLIEKLQDDLKNAHKLAKTDSLTGIANRHGFDEMLDRQIELAKKNAETFCILIVDLDHFKVVNDTYGHLVGDTTLRYLAKLLDTETKGHDRVARYGGEEFVILLNKITYDNALRFAENIRANIARKSLRARGHETPLRITVSIGVAIYQIGEPAESFFERADKALYLAKNKRNQVCGEHHLEH
ncbi:GGDEF domain-containing protein [Thiomicrospira sp. ALE5]|uniref:GGDEF domain-containing protein n=1 Tax=Thiomicrospira sp. ALE5 TaxID=748650 RepID=UPI0008F41619|nr:GGDEF domain-containing protein [Thiomicrospira sp. ALE5]SFR52449.1 diguanylate cyclase [Thiomicrospira sp. ALE5]